MSPVERLLRRALTWLRFAGRRSARPDYADAALVALADEYLANERALRGLLERDGRDTDDIPAFTPLADRQAELVRLIANTPARGPAGLVVKAHAVRLRPFRVGYDAVATLGWSLAGDITDLFERTS